MLTFLNSQCQEKNARVLSMKKTLPFKTIKKIPLVDTQPDLYLILRFLCIPLEKSHVPLVENRWPIWWLNMWQHIFFPQGGTVWYTMMTCNDVSHIITSGMKQKNIISKNWTGLNGFSAEQLLYEVKYKCHCLLKLDVVNKLPVINTLNLKSLKTTVLRTWLRSWIWGRSTVEVRFDEDSDGKVIS